ncbi:MAG: aminoacyl--tRNA ligase-related protein [Candidatus Berkelbacteria bacterium]
MLQSQLFFKTLKETPADADSINASYFVRACFVQKQMAGVYSLLPLGLRVYKKIEQVIREEMDKIGGQEILMNVLQPKELWDETGRSESAIDILYKFKDARDKELLLAPTHEEQVIDIFRNHVKSYKNLPLALYQIQTKFRNEPRAKSGLLRGREFIMKDMYSFHVTEADFENFYEKAKNAYLEIFKRLEVPVKYVRASGGIFSEFSHEFQALTEIGEDTIYYCDDCDFAENKEIAKVKEGDKCPNCGGVVKVSAGVEIGNIFPLSTKYTKAMNTKITDQDGKDVDVIMGCYGIGLTRLMATIVEMKYSVNENKMFWPVEAAPFDVHLISLNQNTEAEKVYKKLTEKGLSVLFDDRDGSAGEKFAEADLIGVVKRVIVSTKSLAAGGVEVVDGANEAKIVKIEDLSF